MSKLIPLIKKNITLLKRNIIKVIFSSFIPTIYLFLIYMSSVWVILETKSLYDFSPTIDYSNPTFFNKILVPNIALIGENANHLEKIKEIISESSSSHTITFESIDKFNKFFVSDEYIYGDYTYNFIVELFEPNKDDLDVSFKLTVDKNYYSFKTKSENLNELNIDRDTYTLNDLHQVDFLAYLHSVLFKFKFNLDKYKDIAHNKNLMIKTFPLKSASKYPNLSPFLSLFSISYIYIMMGFFSWIFIEKDKKQTVLLRRQGVTIFQYFSSLILTYLALIIVPTVINSLLLKYIFQTTNFFTIFLTMILFSLDLLAMTLLLSQIATYLGKSILISFNISSVLLAVFFFDNLTFSSKLLFSLIFPQLILQSNLDLLYKARPFPNGFDITMYPKIFNGDCYLLNIGLLIFDFIMYCSLAYLIFDDINFTKICSKKLATDEEDTRESNKNLVESYFIETILEKSLLDQQKRKETLQIINVTHKYKTSKTACINNLSLELFKSQILVLFGNNGSGKSTLVKIVSGTLVPDHGEIIVDNINIYQNKDYIYSIVGIESQDNIVFDNLTVRENLKMMSSIKGEEITKDNEDDLNEMIRRIGLEDYVNHTAGSLSDGLKRKLCLGLAIVGNSKLIILDEPTLGLDITSKRLIWNYLQTLKQGKIILVATHSLEEADNLGDRIAILKEGSLICCGSTSILKEKYCTGFNLNILINEDLAYDYRVELINNILRRYKNSVLRINGKDMVSVKFSDLTYSSIEIFNYIESIKSRYRIVNYTVSSNSLEDVFSKINFDNKEECLVNYRSHNSINEPYENDVNELEIRNDINNLQQSSIIDVNPLVDRGSQKFLKHSYLELFYIDYKKNCSRNFKTIWRRKYQLFLEILTCVSIIFLLLVQSILLPPNKVSLKTMDILHDINRVVYLQNPSLDEKINNPKTELFPFLSNIYYDKEMNPTIKNPTYDFDQHIFNLSDKHDIKAGIYLNSHGENTKFTIGYTSASSDFQLSLLEASTKAFVTSFDSKLGTDFQVIDNYSNFQQNLVKNTTLELISIINIIVIVISVIPYIDLSGLVLRAMVNERTNKITYFIYLTKVKKSAYWLSLVTSDTFKFSLLTIAVFAMSNKMDFTFYLTAFMFFAIISNIVFIYCFSFLFDDEELAQEIYLALAYIFFFFSSICSYFEINIQTVFFTSIIPTSTMIFYSIKIVESINKSHYFLNGLLTSFLQLVVYGILLFLLDNRKFNRKRINCTCFSNGLLDNNYNNKYVEEQKLKANDLNNTVRLADINITYSGSNLSTVKAVNHLYLGLRPHEKFGLLGFNGSGKSSLFKAIANDVNIDSGDISLFNLPNKDFENVKNLISYCPQTNLFIEYLTVKENIIFFLSNFSTVSVNQVLQDFDLTAYSSSLAVNLSGGNKRKLTFAIAMMNKRQLMLLDEPTTGIDPEARRLIWKNINKFDNNEEEMYNMILTTHSFEETEILCDTIGWIKDGNFIKVGNPEKLKLEASDGYYLEFKVIFSSESNGSINNNEISFLDEIPGYRKNITYNNEITHPQKKDLSKSLYKLYKGFDNKLDSIFLVEVCVNQVKLKISFDLLYQPFVFDYILNFSVSEINLNYIICIVLDN